MKFKFSLTISKVSTPDQADEPLVQFQDITNWLMGLSLTYGYAGVFAVSLIGGISIFFPIPDTLIVFTLAGLKVGGAWSFDAVWIAVFAGIGSAVGEFSGYLLGVGGRNAIIKRCKKQVDFLETVIKKFGAIVIFLFALTPLPDDLVFIPLGVLHYNVIKAFVPALIGKFLMNLLVAYGGRFFIQSIAAFFGIGNDWLPAIISMSLGIIVFILMFKIDWQKYFDKYITSKKSTQQKMESARENT